MARDRFLFHNGNGEGQEEDKEMLSPPLRSARCPPPPSAVGVNGGGVSYITHTVTKFDTLAGVAIKYGVEVADIKRLNGLMTDLQMFALKTLQIPSPGKHPPSPIMSNADENRPKRPNSSSMEFSRRNSDFSDSFQSFKLRPSSSEGCEMSLYCKNSKEEERFSDDFGTKEKLLNEEISSNSASSTPISATITGKALALRPKSANRTVSLTSKELISGVRKSFELACLARFRQHWIAVFFFDDMGCCCCYF